MVWILQAALLSVLGILLKRYLNWKQHYAVYIVFILVIGLVTTWISHILVLNGFLEFPDRPFKRFLINNPIYDMLFFPGIQLLFIQAAENQRKTIVILVFALTLTIQDYLTVRYSHLLLFHKWTLSFTFLFGYIHFSAALWFYNWLQRMTIDTERNAVG